VGRASERRQNPDRDQAVQAGEEGLRRPFADPGFDRVELEPSGMVVPDE